MRLSEKKGVSHPIRILIVDDEENMRHMLGALLRKNSYQVDTAVDGVEALDLVGRTKFDFILCDLKMPRMDGIRFLKNAGPRLQETTVIMMSAYGTIESAVEAMKLGAYDFISKPFQSDEVLLVLEKARERDDLKRENRWLKDRIHRIQEHYRFGTMVARSKAMESVFQLSEKVAPYDTTILITGESGTGKELLARGIHEKSTRSEGPMVPVNCGGIPENLLESELFGYKKGAFTGAVADRKGLFDTAEKGTLFLDEIGELPLSLQVKLLRVLQENEIRPVGDSKTRIIDVRILAATAKNLKEEVEKGRFREDLYYRLNVVQVNIPPLRERPEDITLLCRYFIERFNIRLGKQVQGIEPTILKQLLKRHWAGNVRELENAIERAMVLSDDPVLTIENFAKPELQPSDTQPEDWLPEGYSLKAAQRVLEERLIRRALESTQGNRTHASRLLEISHPSLLSKIKAYEIDL